MLRNGLQLMEAETIEQLPSSEFLYAPSFSRTDLVSTREFWTEADVDIEQECDICKIQQVAN